MTRRIKRAAGRLAAAAVAAGALALASPAMASPTGAGTSYIPQRVGVRGTVPNPGTQQQELSNITLPAPYNVFEFTATCAGCHGGSIDQQVAHFGVQSGTAMASSARDPIFRANQIAVNNILRTLTGEDGAGNMCFRCHSPNGWYSGRFDPTLGGDAEGRTMMHSIIASTDDQGISCEQCHRVVGAVQFQRPGVPATSKAFNLLAAIGGYPADPGWPHDGGPFVDQAGDPTVHPGAPLGDTSLQYSEGMAYSGPYSGTVAPSFSDVPVAAWGATDYTGQIFAVYPPGDPRVGQPVLNVDGSISPAYEQPIGAPIDWAKSNLTTNPPTLAYDYQAQSMSMEHPTLNNGFITKSEFCGSCHDLTVPVLNHGMPEQRTYTEWRFSAYSKPTAAATFGIPVRAGVSAGEVRCQDCHMPQVRHEYADDAAAGPQADPLLTGWFPYAKDRNPNGGAASHKHAGANRDLDAMMKLLYPQPDQEVVGVPTGADVRVFPGMLSTRDPMYDRNARNNEISMADAVKLRIAAGPTETATGSGVYEVTVKVENRTGHRIPTGYPDGRRMWIGLQVTDATGAAVYTSGSYDAADAKLYTDPSAKAFARAQSNVIDATVAGGNAVMVYERVTCRDGLVPGAPLFDGAKDGICEDGGSPFLPNNTIMFDNRIPPAGFTYADYRTGGIKFWNYAMVANPNAGGALRPQPCEDAAGHAAAIGGSCAGLPAGYQRYPDGQGFDVVTYRFAAPTGQALTARAQIYWQTHTREFMEHLRDQQESLGLVDNVRPEGPINATMVGYPLTPSYLSDVINLAAIADPYQPAGTKLRDNWGGIAYAAWLQTGKGTPAVVAAADTAVTAPPGTPAGLSTTATAGVPFEATIRWNAVAGAEGYLVSILYGCPSRAQLVDAVTLLPQVDAKGQPVVDGTHCFDPVKDAGKNEISTVGRSTSWERLAIVQPSACDAAGVCSLVNTAMNVNKSYGFKVAAFNAAGFSADSAVFTYKSPWDIPLPANLLKALTITSNSVTLTWTDTADNETIFVVQMVPVQPLPTAPLSATLTPTGGGTSVTAPPAPEQVFVFTTQTPGLNGFGGNQQTIAGLSPNTAYNFQVQACNATACSGLNTNGPIQIATLALLSTPVLAVPAVTLDGATGAPSVALSWSAVPTATGYNVERSTDGGVTFTALGSVAAPAVGYADATAQNAASYQYRVVAVRANPAPAPADLSAPSTAQAVTTPPAPVALAAPTLSAPLAVNLSWNAVAGATSYSVERATGAGAFASLATGVAATSHADLTAAQGATYSYRVFAVGAGGSSIASNVRTLTTPALTQPSAPVVTAKLSAAPPPVVSLSWSASAPSVTGYQLKRTAALAATAACPTAAASYANLGPATTALATTDVTAATANRTYCYRVVATNAAGSTASAPAKVLTPPAPAAATQLSATFSKVAEPRPARVVLKWQFSNAPVRPTSFVLERATNSGFTANLVSIPVATPAAGTSATFTDTTMVAGTRYWYRVRALNGPMSSVSGSVNGTPR